MSGTPTIPGWYINFQAAVLKQLPRPGEIDQQVAEGWESNQASLKNNLAECLLPPTPKTVVTSVETNLLEFVSTVTVSATTTKFVAKDNFIINTEASAKVKISYLGNNFKAWLRGKTEDQITEQTLHYSKLRQSSVDGPIIAELGGEEKSETTLTEMFFLMEKQRNGEAGVLLNNGYANIFYIRDACGVLRAVHVDWYDGGWDVNADTVAYPDGWIAGRQVFSRNPSES